MGVEKVRQDLGILQFSEGALLVQPGTNTR